MAFASAVERDKERKTHDRRMRYIQAFHNDALTPQEIADFKKEFPREWADAFKVKRSAEMKAERDALIEECTSPIPPNMQYMAQEEWLRRNNLLLAAILKHLTRDL